MDNKVTILKDEYRDFAAAHGQSTDVGDYKTANVNHDRLIEALKKLRALGRDGELALLSLIENQNDSVAGWAATHSLQFDESHAIVVLNKLSKKPGPIGFNAKMVLQQWRKGQLKLP